MNQVLGLIMIVGGVGATSMVISLFAPDPWRERLFKGGAIVAMVVILSSIFGLGFLMLFSDFGRGIYD
jgi:hypothetical protein